MDFSQRLSISYYKNIAVLNEGHNICIVQHLENKKIFVKKKLHVFNKSIYSHLQAAPIEGIPHIVEIYEENSSLIIVEEYISGETLQEKINSRTLTESQVNSYIKELCTILIKLHSQYPPIIHRDIKPSNIIITPSDRVVLLDFNVAKYFTDIKSPDTVLLGTKGYAAPEQYGFGSSTQQTDIYAIGILLKELLSALPTPTGNYDAFIAKCTQLNPADRFWSVAELYKKLSFETIDNNTNFFQINSWKSFIPPGFRTKTPWRMISAGIGYFLLFWLCFNLNVQHKNVVEIWVERFFCLLTFLSVLFVGANYLNIQNILPLCQSKLKVVHYLGIVILDFMLLTLLMILMSLIEAMV